MPSSGWNGKFSTRQTSLFSWIFLKSFGRLKNRDTETVESSHHAAECDAVVTITVVGEVTHWNVSKTTVLWMLTWNRPGRAVNRQFVFGWTQLAFLGSFWKNQSTAAEDWYSSSYKSHSSRWMDNVCSWRKINGGLIKTHSSIGCSFTLRLITLEKFHSYSTLDTSASLFDLAATSL